MTIAEMIVIAWSLTVGLTDIYTRRIPNMLTLGFCLVAILWLLVTGHSILNASWQSVLLATFISQLFTVPAYAAHLLGAGDAKLLLAIALLSGKDITLTSFVIASILAVIYCVSNRLIARLNARRINSGRWFPFGAALSIGLVCAIGMGK